MLLDANYAIWGGAFATLITLLVGIFFMRGVRHVRQVFQVHHEGGAVGPNPADTLQDAEHRAMMFIMNQKTDSILSALAETIERERQKLGVVVRKPSMPAEIDPAGMSAAEMTNPARVIYEQVLPLAQKGESIGAIARQLDLSEAEVSLVMHLDAA